MKNIFKFYYWFSLFPSYSQSNLLSFKWIFSTMKGSNFHQNYYFKGEYKKHLFKLRYNNNNYYFIVDCQNVCAFKLFNDVFYFFLFFVNIDLSWMSLIKIKFYLISQKIKEISVKNTTELSFLTFISKLSLIN